MAFNLTWQIEGDRQLSRTLTRIETNLKNFKLPLQTIADNLNTLFAGEVFTTRGSVIGERWDPLSPNTLKQKKRMGYSSQPLVATGAMQAGFRSIVSSDQAVIYNTQDYFKYHQSNRPRKKLPRRVMMKLAAKQKEMIVKEFQNFIMLSERAGVSE